MKVDLQQVESSLVSQAFVNKKKKINKALVVSLEK